jgi:hypothetical protein
VGTGIYLVPTSMAYRRSSSPLFTFLYSWVSENTSPRKPTPSSGYKHSVAPLSLIKPNPLPGRKRPLRVTGLVELATLDSFIASCQSEVIGKKGGEKRMRRILLALTVAAVMVVVVVATAVPAFAAKPDVFCSPGGIICSGAKTCNLLLHDLPSYQPGQHCKPQQF